MVFAVTLIRYLRMLGENTSPLNRIRGFSESNVFSAVTKRVAPPIGSFEVVTSTLYTSL